jgi:hypothetical protein
MAPSQPPDDLVSSLMRDGYLKPAGETTTDRTRAVSDQPLAPLASWYSSDAWMLFQAIYTQCGLAAATAIFEKCIAMGVDDAAAKGKRERAALVRARQAPLKLPTLAEINAADRERICIWWARLLAADQKFTAKENRIIARLSARYFKFGGQPAGFKPRLPPIKKPGAVKRDAVNAALPAMFDATNPQSAFSIEKAKHNGRLTKERFAEIFVERYGRKHGPTAEAVLHNERNWRKKNRKV